MSQTKNLSTVEKLMDGYNPHRERQEETRGLIKKWEPTGLLEGLKDEQKVNGMAVLLENQARQLIDESSHTGTSANSEEWSGVALPLVRKIFGELAAQEFVSVQPMNLPSGLIFYLDFKYGTAQAGFGDGDQVFGITSASNADPSQGLYGAGRSGYSINDHPGTSYEIGLASEAGANSTGSITWADVDFEPDLSASLSNLKYFDVPVSTLTNPDLEGVKAYEITGSTAFDAFYPAYTKVLDGVNGNEVEPSSGEASHIRFIVDEVAAAGLHVTVNYHKQPTDTTRGDFEATSAQVDANPETDIDIPEIDIAMRSIAIVAKTRKLKAVWTPELAQDLNAYHSVDAEAELTSLLSEYVSMEIDLEILDMLHMNALAKTERWSARVGFEYDPATTLFAESSGASNAYTKGDWFQTLGNKIQSVSNAIHQKTLRGGANFIVVSPEVATILESIPGYATSSDGDVSANSYAMGVQKAGLLNNRYTVYKNPYQFENVILVGFRGSNFLETGAVYAPYVPLIMTPLVYDPKNFTPRKGVMTRYAKKMVRPEFYGKVIVADVNFA
tara:strand:- start:6865 stop:8535 length:1671 start_codon:yes stop_codon:yes gene_type:complete